MRLRGHGAAVIYRKETPMTQLVGQVPEPTTGSSTDLSAAVQLVLAASSEPLTLSKIRSQLPPALRAVTLEELAEFLQRQVAANVLIQFPKYRSQQDRFWDRSMSIHIASLLRTVLAEGPLGWSELKRKLPAYAQTQAEPILRAQVSQGLLYQHPRLGSRGSERFGLQPPDAREYLRPKLAEIFRELAELEFSRAQIREAALELLHEEEWGSSIEEPAQAIARPESAAPQLQPASIVPTPPAVPDASAP
jgi:hypothetical protein